MKTPFVILCGALLISAACAQSAPSAPAACNASQFRTAGGCQNYDMNSDKTSANYDAIPDSGHTSWILTATALTMLMTPAIGLFYAGLYKAETATNTILLSFVALAVITIEWILFGYSFAWGPGSKGYGNFKWGLYYHVASEPSGVYAPAIPHILWTAFQNMFAAMAPAFLSGAVVGRMKFGVFIIYIICYTLVVYNCLCHWIWGGYIDPDTYLPAPLGWLMIRGAYDYAGGAVIHITAGFSALAVAILLGRRRDYLREPPRPHNLPLVAIGFTLIWFGWFGYTGGSVGFANGTAAHAVINTQIAASTGMLWWIGIEYLCDRRVTLTQAAYGALAGLVTITPAAGYVWPWTSIIFGIFGASFGSIFSRLKYYLRYDDPLDVFAIHGVCGTVGMFMTGLFATQRVDPFIPQGGSWYGEDVQLGYQVAGIVVAASFSFVCTFLIVFILKKTIGIRVSDKNEDLGLDYRYHGAPAYYFEEPVVSVVGVHTGVNRVGGIHTGAGGIHTGAGGIHTGAVGTHHHHHQQVLTTEGALKRDEHVIST